MSGLDPTDPASPYRGSSSLRSGRSAHWRHHRALARSVDTAVQLRGPYAVTFEDVAGTLGDTALDEVDTAVVELFTLAEGEWLYDIWPRVITSFGSGNIALSPFAGADPDTGQFLFERGNDPLVSDTEEELDTDFVASPSESASPRSLLALASNANRGTMPGYAKADVPISVEYFDATPVTLVAGEALWYALVVPAPTP